MPFISKCYYSLIVLILNPELGFLEWTLCEEVCSLFHLKGFYIPRKNPMRKFAKSLTFDVILATLGIGLESAGWEKEKKTLTFSLYTYILLTFW